MRRVGWSERVRQRDRERENLNEKRIFKDEQKMKIIISPMLGDFRLSKFVIDIFLMSEKMELVERRLSPKFMMFETDNLRLSLCERSGSDTLTWFPVAFPFAVRLAPDSGDDGVDFSIGSDNDDLLIEFSSCSSAIVAGCGCCCCVCNKFSFSLFSSSLGFGDVGGDIVWIAMGGGGDGVISTGEGKIGSFELPGESGGSDMQIEACCTVNRCDVSSNSNFCMVRARREKNGR